jgi:MoxR-like ATPase
MIPVRSMMDAGARRSEAADATTAARPAVALDDHVAEITRVAGPSLQQAPARDDAALDGVAHEQSHEVGPVDRPAAPRLGAGERPPSGVELDGQPGGLTDLVTQGEPVPDRQLRRRHRPGAVIDRTDAGHPARDGPHVVGARGQHAADEAGERRPHVPRRRGDAVAHEHPALVVDDARGQPAHTEVDREVPRRGRHGFGATRAWYDARLDGIAVGHRGDGSAPHRGDERTSCGAPSTLPSVTDAATSIPPSSAASSESATFAALFDAIVANVTQVVHGKREVVELALVALLAEGHLLIEDVPGVGKTSLAKAIAASIDCSWKRVQFTPDLLPSDLVGVSIFERATETFRFVPGPLFANIVLADEINRASPKTQSALLEAMEERQVTVDGTTYPLPPPFMVIATQNPVEPEGTYRLPESQLDRFLLRLSLGYPGRTAEIAILDGQGSAEALRKLSPVVSSAEIRSMIERVRGVYLASALKSYLVDISEASRRHPAIELGLSPRATLQLSAASRAYAAAQGRDYATPDDVKSVAVPVLSHRLVLRADRGARMTPADAIGEVLAEVAVPIAR